MLHNNRPPASQRALQRLTAFLLIEAVLTTILLLEHVGTVMLKENETLTFESPETILAIKASCMGISVL